MTSLYPDYVLVHPVPCELDTYDRYFAGCLARDPGMHGPVFWPGSPCLVQDRMCLTCGGVDPADYDPAVHGPGQSLLAPVVHGLADDKRTMACPWCGKTVDRRARKCPHCGRNLLRVRVFL